MWGQFIFKLSAFSNLRPNHKPFMQVFMKKKSNRANAQLNLFATDPDSDTQQANERKTASGFSFDLWDALRAPVITPSQMWADTIPERLLKNLPIERMIAYKKGEQMATYLECSIYLYTASLEAPMTQEWAEITCHVSCKVLEDLFG